MSCAFFLSIFSVATLGGCIKENRCDCPCYLMLDFSAVDGEKFDSLSIGVVGRDGFLYESSLARERFGDTFVIEVPRGKVDLCVVACEKDSGMECGEGVSRADLTRIVSASGLNIPEGSQCPPLHMYTSSLDTSDDSIRDTVILHKNYCLLSIEMVSKDSPSPFSVGIRGQVSGYAPDGSLIPGVFAVDNELSQSGRCSVRVPRQSDASLSLQVLDSEDIVREFALGEYIVKSGFDWTALDLEDLDVTVDFALARVAVVVREWETRYVYDLEI